MNYKIDIDQIKKDMRRGNTLNHGSSKRIKILPFNTTYKDVVYNWDAILGEISRLIMGQEPEQVIIPTEVFSKIRKLVESDEPEVLIDFIKALYFKETGKIEAFHPSVFAYASLDSQAKNDQKNTARFIYDVLIRRTCEEEFKKLYLSKGDLVVRLLNEALPEMKPYILHDTNYVTYEPKVAKVFGEDLKILLKDEKLFIKWIKEFIKYYYFFYTSQTTLKLNQRLRATDKLIPLYFLIGSEKGGRNRMSSKQGFKLLKAANENTFANVMLCQFLNYNAYDEAVYTLPEWYKHYSEGIAAEDMKIEIDGFIAFYKKEISNVPWEQIGKILSKGSNVLEESVEHAYDHIKLQFAKGGRASAAKEYEKWFYKFASENYTKNGGSLGYLLHIEEDTMLFLIGLTVGEQEKEHLNIVFDKLEQRGICLDDYSKQYIVEMLEIRNLLEKKSDSGDAKYVRAIL